jgi:hypothetical protein
MSPRPCCRRGCSGPSKRADRGSGPGRKQPTPSSTRHGGRIAAAVALTGSQDPRTRIASTCSSNLAAPGPGPPWRGIRQWGSSGGVSPDLNLDAPGASAHPAWAFSTTWRRPGGSGPPGRSAMVTRPCGGVAQLARAPRSHRGGRGFDSHHLHPLGLAGLLVRRACESPAPLGGVSRSTWSPVASLGLLGVCVLAALARSKRLRPLGNLARVGWRPRPASRSRAPCPAQRPAPGRRLASRPPSCPTVR